MKNYSYGIMGLLFVGVVWVFAFRADSPRLPKMPVKPIVLAKAKWPTWEVFRMGVERLESSRSKKMTHFVVTESYSDALALFTNGKAQGATLTIFEAIEAAALGKQVRIVLLLDYTVGSDAVVAKLGVNELSDLRGKKIGIEPGTIAHFTLLKALEKGAVDPKEVQLINGTMEELRAAFISGQLDAVGTYEPYMSTMMEKGQGHPVFSSKEIPRSICDVLFVSERTLKESPDIVQHWIMAWDQTVKTSLQREDQFYRDVSSMNKTPIKELKSQFEGIFLTDIMENRRAFGSAGAPGYLLESLREMHQFMLEHKVIKSPIDLKSMVHHQVISTYLAEKK